MSHSKTHHACAEDGTAPGRRPLRPLELGPELTLPFVTLDPLAVDDALDLNRFGTACHANECLSARVLFSHFFQGDILDSL